MLVTKELEFEDRHFTSVNVACAWYEWQPFILATQAVFYVSDTKLHGDWQVVQHIQPRNEFDVLEIKEEFQDDGDTTTKESFSDPFYCDSCHLSIKLIISDGFCRQK